MLTLNDIKWAAKECERQNSGELSVFHLCNALHFARDMGQFFDLLDILLLGEKVEPIKNMNGFRQVPVYFANFTQAIDYQNIESALTSLIKNGHALTSIEWYREFETIHPFIDGNGRVGAILFNLKNRTIRAPIAPPEVFEDMTASAKVD